MFEIDCPKCDGRMSADLDTYRCDRCGHEVFMGRVALDRAKQAFADLKAAFGKLSLGELKARAWDEADPFTAAVIAILAFFVAKSVALPVAIAALRAAALLLGPFGLLLIIVVPIIAHQHQEAIRRRAAEMSGQPAAEPDAPGAQAAAGTPAGQDASGAPTGPAGGSRRRAKAGKRGPKRL